MDLLYSKIMHFENILFYVKYKQKFQFYLHLHTSRWLQKVLFLTNFEACLNVINTALQKIMYWVRVLHIPTFYILHIVKPTACLIACLGVSLIVHSAHHTQGYLNPKKKKFQKYDVFIYDCPKIIIMPCPANDPEETRVRRSTGWPEACAQQYHC
jgi:hypothetical protein